MCFKNSSLIFFQKQCFFQPLVFCLFNLIQLLHFVVIQLGNSPLTTTYDPEIVDFSPNFTQIFDSKFDCDASSLHEWTEWYDRDDPSGYADSETFSALVTWVGGHPCSVSASTSATSVDHIDDIECREVGTDIDYYDYTFDTDVKFHYCTKELGFKCQNGDTGTVCPDFEVRYCCYMGEYCMYMLYIFILLLCLW